jgi:hypothetical protein
MYPLATRSINSVIDTVIIELELSDDKKRAMFNNAAVNWYEQTYSSRYAKITKSEFFMVGENRRLIAPVDMVQWLRMGIQFGDTIRTLQYNTTLSELAPTADTKAKTDYWNRLPSVDNLSWPYLMYYHNPIYTEYGNSTNGEVGEFSFDVGNREFLFSSRFVPQQVILTYLYSGIGTLDDPILTFAGAAALEKFLKYKYFETKDPRSAMVLKRDYQGLLVNLNLELNARLISNAINSANEYHNTMAK